MAKTIAEIQQVMINAKVAEPNLATLTSTSKTSIWQLTFLICAASIKWIEDLFKVQKQDVEKRRLEIPVGVLKWYASESLVYQYGDVLVFDNGRVDYSPVNSDNFVVDLAAADIINGVVVIKVAKLVAGFATPLSASELAGITTYWNQKRFAGTSISIISNAPDKLKAEYRIIYDSQILASNGSLLTDPSVFPINNSIDSFLQSFQDSSFAGTMQVMKLTDAIQKSEGVINVIANNIEAKPDGGTFLDVLAVANQEYTAIAGYMIIDPVFPLSSTLTYIPE